MTRTLGLAATILVAGVTGVTVVSTAAAATPQYAPPPGPPTPVEILENENPLGLVDGGTGADNIVKNAGGLAGNAINTVELNLPLP
ncbi:hypothetical protein [Pseudonocardia endophytica]|uniref:Small secreted domain DUF320 n=1 Tax=Pseudonocardia endophytica TaxID=401976 RepID=A0A4R1I887_PSEEN|nr:hypothetical protein [Pseudonocardia endophytica]TCK26362.1 hypothetical protein EV378_2195 [Pseudonocardia endophytica]